MEAHIIHYLFCCFDLHQDAKLRVVEEMSKKFAAIVDSAARLASDPGEDDPLHSIASLYQTRANSATLPMPCPVSPGLALLRSRATCGAPSHCRSSRSGTLSARHRGGSSLEETKCC